MVEPKVNKDGLRAILKGLEPEITEDELNEAWEDLVKWCATKSGKTSQERKNEK